MMGLVLLGAAALCLLLGWRVLAANRARMDAMAHDELEYADEPDAFHWEEHVDDAEAWKGDDDDDDHDDHGDFAGVR